ncbi:MAG: rRNA pseudouridine synthase [Ignavibacteria bacterium]|nr:rRNA pseudouridine synthase [Ignavibacteria bacterium]
MDNLVRLNKFIASNGVSSRRKVDELITQGRVTVNGDTVVELGFKVNPETDKVQVDGENIRVSTKKIYLILNKPNGVITSVSDEKHRTTVIDLIKSKDKIFPVGRLDYNTTGLLLLTNDGELANKLMHPKGEIYKTYFVKLSKPLEEKHRLKLTEGIKLEGKETAPSKIRYPKKNNNYQDLYISIYEGRNRQVRNMFEHYGYFVRELERTEYAGLKIGDLRQGEWRKLTPEEITKLNELVKDSPSGNTKRVHYAKKDQGKDYKKYKARDDKRDVKKDHKRPERKFTKKDSKYGFKDRQVAERDARLGFKKIDTIEDKRDEKKDYKKSDKRFDTKDFKKDYKKFGKSDDRKFEDRKFGKSDDKKFEKKDYKKFDKRDDKGGKTEYRKFDKPEDKKVFKKDYKKFDKGGDKRFEKKDYKKFDKREDTGVKKEFKKFGTDDDKKTGKPGFKKFNKFDKKDSKRRFKKR